MWLVLEHHHPSEPGSHILSSHHSQHSCQGLPFEWPPAAPTGLPGQSWERTPPNIPIISKLLNNPPCCLPMATHWSTKYGHQQLQQVYQVKHSYNLKIVEQSTLLLANGYPLVQQVFNVNDIFLSVPLATSPHGTSGCMAGLIKNDNAKQPSNSQKPKPFKFQKTTASQIIHAFSIVVV